jgi:mono/diheme cytochrome c family protein
MSRRLGLAAAAWVAAFAVHAQEPAVAATSAAGAASSPAPSAEAGRRAYTSTCARCHGIGLVVTSSAYFDLRTFPKEDKARFIDSVTNGKRQMPAWGGILKPETVESLWLYLGSVNGW